MIGRAAYTSEAQVELTVSLMDALDIEQTVLVGNSAGGTVSMLTALAYPDRVEALVLVDAAVHAGGSPGWIRPILHTPQIQHLGPLVTRWIQNWGLDFARSAWHDPNLITDEVWEGYLLPLRADNWDRALWELTVARRPSGLDERLSEFSMPILIMTGDDDRIVPTDDSIRLHDAMPGSELVIIPGCRHVPQEECPDAFMQAVLRFAESLD